MQDHEIHPWLTRMIQGDSQAFYPIYQATKDHVYRMLRFLLNNKEDAADVMSEVYLNVWHSLPSYDFNQPFRSWLNGLIIRQASNWRRKLWRKMRLFERAQRLATESLSNQSEEGYLAREQSSEILSLVNKLPYKLREVIVLRHYQDCSLEEVADVLQVPLGTVKSRHHSAIRKLRQLTEHHYVPKEASIRAD
ncbi:sigma-70 family RNA polymerase sigma factor [Cohnella sp. WQ 127256]|uniref:sigma-70 family RNA polymerase sigma factor n=1 Tax=Cohnella sp. WQ 127256 TaxID=2938790 RepID=UPI002118B5AF|nr:sigma-70 family RNA polymerase sigma factor [Cohnella sp. WQ 127256]